jgi:ornithine cyclodeaminase/alanine dehydrogenase-like protein (mu-crystallin family)
MLILSHADVETVLDVASCIPVMTAALMGFARGDWLQPARSQFRMDGGRILLGLMPAFRDEGRRLLALKEIVRVPRNRARGLDTHQGAVLLHDGEDGRLFAIVDATAITAIRTAAVSAVATQALARPDTARVAVIGTGVQAHRHIEAMRTVFPAAEIVLWGRSAASAAALAEKTAVHHCDTIEAATAGAGVICTVTASPEPLLRRSMVAPGCHINAVGASAPNAREIAGDLVAAAELFVDSRAQAEIECGELRLAIEEGAIGPAHVRGELGEVLIRRAPGRSDPGCITLFKSLGLAIEDLAAAEAAVMEATARGVGTRIAW